MTLLFLTSVQSRSTLLQILADSMVDEEDRLLDLDDLPNPYEDLEDEDPEYALVGAGEDFEDDGDEEETSFELDPHQPMQATPAGVEALLAASMLEDWLRSSPFGPLEIGEVAAGRATASLLCGWGTGVVHAMASEPLTLPEINAAVAEVPYRTIEERIDSLERSGLIEVQTDAEGGTRYAATLWLREGIAPIAAAARVEGRHPAEDIAPTEGVDAEAIFLLALPLLELPPGTAGSCRLAVQLRGGTAGVTAQIADGRVASCTTELAADADASATATTVDWLDTLIEPAKAQVALDGDEQLAATVLAGLHERLFKPPEFPA